MDKWFYIVITCISVLLLALGLAFYREPFLGYVFIVVFMFASFNVWVLFRYVRFKNKRIESTEKKLQEKDTLLQRKKVVEEKLLHDLPTGIIMINEAFDIEWANHEAKNIFENILESKNLDLIYRPLKEKIALDDTSQPFVMKIYEHFYEIVYDGLIQTVFLYRVTQREELKKKYADHTDVIAVLHLDNFEDAVSVLDVQEKNEIQGKLLGALDDWADDFGFYLVPISVNKIMLFMHKKNLVALIDSQF